MAILREGFHQVVHGTDPYTELKPLASAKMDLSAKTGTAETVAEVIQILRQSIVISWHTDQSTIRKSPSVLSCRTY